MAQYPCSVCEEECQNGTILCTGCKKWAHAGCTYLTDNDLISWSNKSLNFICVKCAFKNGLDYDATSALLR